MCEGAEVGFITITMEDVDLAAADALKACSGFNGNRRTVAGAGKAID